MKSFLLRLMLFTALIGGLLTALTRFTDKRLRARNEGQMKVWHQAEAGMINADVLVIGNSHAHVQVNPRLLQAAFPGKRIYNLGLEGYTFDLQLARYKFYRRYNKALEAVIFCVDYFQFNKSKWAVDKPQFLPYMYDSAVSKALLSIGVSRTKTLLPFLKYRGEANAVMAAITGASPLPEDAYDRRGWDGFEPMPYHWNEKAFNADTARANLTPVVDSAVWHSFEGWLRECALQHINVFVVFTPHHRRYVAKVIDEAGYKLWLRNQLAEHISFIDFSNAPFCADTTLFYNGTHLNEKGADIFSAALADSLRQKL